MGRSRGYPWNSPYAFSENRVIDAVELEGLEASVLNSPVGNVKPNSKFLDTRTCSVCSQTHGGTDYPVPTGTDVQVTSSGTVVRANKSNSYGNVVVVDHGTLEDGVTHVYTLYAHNDKLNVSKGDKVETGDVIAQSGSTGNSTGPHVHYEVVVTGATPDQGAFYGNLKIRHAPEELVGILGGEVTPPDPSTNSAVANNKQTTHTYTPPNDGGMTSEYEKGIKWANESLYEMREKNTNGVFDQLIKTTEQYRDQQIEKLESEGGSYEKKYKYVGGPPAD